MQTNSSKCLKLKYTLKETQKTIKTSDKNKNKINIVNRKVQKRLTGLTEPSYIKCHCKQMVIYDKLRKILVLNKPQ